MKYGLIKQIVGKSGSGTNIYSRVRYRTTPPKVTSLTRSGRKFTLNYTSEGSTGYEFSTYINGKKVENKISTSESKGSHSYTVDSTTWSTIKSIKMNVYAKKETTTQTKTSGNTKYITTYSYVTSKVSGITIDFTKRPPSTPTDLTYTAESESNGKLTWEQSNPNSDTTMKPLKFCKAEWVFIDEYNDSPENAFDYAKNNGIAVKTFTSSDPTNYWLKFNKTPKIDKSTMLVARVTACGPSANSASVIISNTYAYPKVPVVNKLLTSTKGVSRYIECNITSDANYAYPRESVSLMHGVGTPKAALESPDSITYTTLTTKSLFSSDKTTNRNITLSSNPTISISNNQVMYAMAEAANGLLISTSEPSIIAKGTLSKSTINSVEIQKTAGNAVINATNGASEIPDSIIEVEYRTSNDWLTLGTIEHDESDTSVIFQNDVFKTSGDDYQIRIRTAVVSVVGEEWYSDWVYSDWKKFPIPPQNLKAELLSDGTTAKLTWSWSWADATGARISWSDHKDAWCSTDAPSTYDISDVMTEFNISDLSSKTYYFRVRLIDQSGDKDIYSPWSEIIELNIAATPVAPTLAIQNHVITVDGRLNCTVGCTNVFERCQIAEYKDGAVWTINGNPITLYDDISSQAAIDVESVNILYSSLGLDGWTTGDSRQLVARVISTNGGVSADWSTPVNFSIAKPISLTVESSLVEEEVEERTTHVLKTMPLTVKTTSSGRTKIVISQAQDCALARPDERNEEKYEGQVVYADTNDDGVYTINVVDLFDKLDERCIYNLVVSATDQYGQTANQTIEFEPHWTHQPEIPTVSYAVETEERIAKFSVAKPASYEDGDTYDVYRLSNDYPQKVLEDCEFDTEYVDPYPSLGEAGGHRFVSKTANGDSVDANSVLTWLDKDTNLNLHKLILENEENYVELIYDLSVESAWTKDFTRTTYLGGSIAGDWNPAVTRDLNLTVSAVDAEDPDIIKSLRRIASSPSICHVRTPDGASFACDCQISETWDGKSYKTPTFSLTIKQVDIEGFDGMTYEEWKKESEEDGVE